MFQNETRTLRDKNAIENVERLTKNISHHVQRRLFSQHTIPATNSALSHGGHTIPGDQKSPALPR